MNKHYSENGNPEHPLFILAHGAGADRHSEFMEHMAAAIAGHGVYVVRFDFPYMIKRQEDGKKRPPDRAPKLLEAYREVITELARGRDCVIGGKSMGGRIASMLAQSQHPQDEQVSEVGCPTSVKGCACLGYPFHPPGKPESLRIDHLQTLSRPQLMVQGTRDAMGNKDEVDGYPLDSGIQWLWLDDGNHDLKPRKASGHTHEAHMANAASSVAAFVKQCLAG